MSPLLPPPSPLWGEGKGEGKFQISLARIYLAFGAWDLVLIISLCSMRHALCYLLIYRFTASNPLQRWASSWGSMV
jgi:hypothetical protein